MATGPQESAAQSTPSQGFLHDICDDYERDRHDNPNIAMGLYIQRAPESLKTWLLRELLAIELDFRQSAGEILDREAIRAAAGVSEETFNGVWHKLFADAETLTLDRQATPNSEGDHSLQFRRSTTLISDSLEFAARIPGHESTIAHTGRGPRQLPRVADDFELIDLLGEGGMGVVYRAYQHSLQRQVALKIIPQRYMSSPQVLARFYIEVEATAAMNHAGIVPVYEFGERNGLHFYAMALVEGGNLAGYVASGGRQPKQRIEPKRAAEILAKVCEAVQYAHDHAVIHRDIKPANILLDQNDHPMLADFGLAKILDKEEESLTMTGNVLGTPAYMAPEQASGEKNAISNRTDVYALGATLYALLTGRPPFEGGGQYEIVQKVVHSSPKPVNTVADGIALDLQIICEKCLAKRPQDRYASASDLAEDLNRYLSGHPIAARPLNFAERLSSWARRHPDIAGLVAAIFAILTAGIIVSNVFRLRAVESETRATASLTRLKTLLNDTLEITRAEDVVSEPSMEPLRNKILSKGKDYYEHLLEELRDDKSLPQDFAEALYSRGKVSVSLGDSDAAREDLERALALLEPLGNVSDPEQLLLAASTHFELGRMGKAVWEARPDKSNERCWNGLQHWVEHARFAYQLREQASNLVEATPESLRLLASALESLGMALGAVGAANEDTPEIAVAIDQIKSAQLIRERGLGMKDGKEAKLVLAYPRGFGNLANLESKLARLLQAAEEPEAAFKSLHRAEQAIAKAVDTHRHAAQLLESDLRARSHLSESLSLQAKILLLLNKPDLAEAALKEAVKEARFVSSRSPFSSLYLKQWAFRHFKLIMLHMDEVPNIELALQELEAYRVTLINALRRQPKNKYAGKILLDGTLGFQQLYAKTNDSQHLQAVHNQFRTIIREINELMEGSDSGEFDWLKKLDFYPWLVKHVSSFSVPSDNVVKEAEALDPPAIRTTTEQL